MTDPDDDPRFDLIQTKVSEWLAAEGCVLAPGVSEDAHWAVQFTYGSVNMLVGQKKGHADVVAIVTSVGAGNLAPRLGALTPAARDRFLWNLRLELLRTGTNFTGLEGTLEQVKFTHRLFWESEAPLRSLFIERLTAVRSAVLTVQWSLAREFTHPPPELDLESTRPN
jgi:hypothetical protein